MTNQIHILIADDHATVREGLLAMLSTQHDFEVVGAASDGVEVVALAQDLKPDVILLDLVMPRQDGLEAIRRIMEQNPEARILLITSFADDRRIFPAIKAGAFGFLFKDTPREQLYQGIRDVAQGLAVLNPTIAYKILHELRQPADKPLTKYPLTPSELKILFLLNQGLGDKEIADELGVEDHMVSQNISSSLRKLHLANRSQTALYAVGDGGTHQDIPEKR